MHWRSALRCLPTALLLLTLAYPGRAAETARDVLDRIRTLNDTTRKWSDRVQHLKLAIVDRRGGEQRRELVISLKKYPEDRNRTLLFFESPPDIKGVGFLQWADPRGKDEQWLYVPELKRVRQISGGAKKESFVGTDFSYEDLAIITQITDWTDSEAHATVLRDEPVDGQVAHVIEFTPTGKDLSYGKILTWVTADELLIVRYEMYDKTGQLEKTLALRDFRKVGNIPTPFHMEMSNVRTNSRTLVDVSAAQYDAGVDDGMFTQRALERGL